MERYWLRIALLNFLAAATLGTVLRLAFVVELPWMKYQYVLHAHSHVAMLGWIYLALFALLAQAFVPQDRAITGRYHLLFWATEITVLGMLLSFPVQGYGAVSIAFSVAHILCSYVLVAWLWRHMGRRPQFSVLLAKTALVFLLLSTLGIWLMGPLMATSLRHSAFYHMAVQYYLHFQFNGWFVTAVLALFFKLSEDHHIAFPARRLHLFYGLLVSSCVLTYALAVVWTTRLQAVLWANSAGVLIQLGALVVFLGMLWPRRDLHRRLFAGWERRLLGLAFGAFTLKIIIQAAVALPLVAEAAYTIRNYIIGFIHLLLLGAITCFLLAYALREKLLTAGNRPAALGLACIVTGFLLSELLLFGQGSLLWAAWGFLPFYYELLFGVSTLIPIGIFLLWWGQRESPAFRF